MRQSVGTSGLTLVALCLTTTTSFAACFDLGRAEPRQLQGELSYHIFAGPPDFEDVQKGDTPEPGYILKLDRTICLAGDDEFADPGHHFDEVHVVPTEATDEAMQRLRNRRVVVELENPIPAMTGHHHRPLVAWVKAITPDDDRARAVVEAFYRALEKGDGTLATTFVIPEKTKTGPFSAKSLTGFYGKLAEPLELLGVEPSGRNSFDVRYRFRSKAALCEGLATVATEPRDDRIFIRSIRAHNGC